MDLEAFRNFENVMDTLKLLAEADTTNAEEYVSIMRAALALSYILLNGHMSEFEQFIEQWNSSLSEEMIRSLKSKGIKSI